jgi:hypothetical protein
MYYYKVDAALIATLAEAKDLYIRAPEITKTGPKITLFAGKVEDARLAEFAAR